MLKAVPFAQEFLYSAEDQGKHVTFDELNDAAVHLQKGFDDALLVAGVFAEMIGPGEGPQANEPSGAPPVRPPIEASEVPSSGGEGFESPGPSPGETRVGNPPPAGRSAQTIKASPPPPPQQASRPGGPTPVTDVDVVKTNVSSPASIKPQPPTAHQTDWTARGGPGTAPPAYRDSQGNVHVSTDHPLMGQANRGGIPPVSPGAQTPPAPEPLPAEPIPTPAPANPHSDIGQADTGQAPPPPKPAADPIAKTSAAPAPPVEKPAVPKKAPTRQERSQPPLPEQPARRQIDPPQAISEEAVRKMQSQPRTANPGRRRSGSNVNYTTDHENHQLAWQRLGGHGDPPSAFIYDGQVYLDPSRWPPSK